ncbi:MAG: hypothetical protein Fur003_0790 [Candidatus Dojkabacteria bacterium]
MKTTQTFAHLIFEIGALKRIKRTPIQNPFITGDSVAEHSYRTSLIASYLAKQEKADLAKVLMMALLHDISEVRCTDTNFMQKPYVKRDEALAHNSIFKDFINSDDYLQLINEYEKRDSLESKIVKDADRIELLATTLELDALGIKEAKRHIDFTHIKNIEKYFTISAKKLANELLNTGYSDWSWNASEV